MKKNLRSVCLLFLVFVIYIAGSVGIGGAEDEYNFSKFNNSDTTWGEIGSPISDYKIWGYTGKTYNFSVNYSVPSPDNTTMIFYWNCSGSGSEYSYLPLRLNDTNDLKKMPHVWNNSGKYLVAVGIFNGPDSSVSCPNISYWVPVEIRNNTTIIVQNFSMLDEKKGSDSNNSAHLYNIPDLAHPSENSSYCGYVDNDYFFSVKLNAISLSIEDNRTINETTTVVYWNYGSSNTSENKSDNSMLTYIIPNVTVTIVDINNSARSIKWDRNFTHDWDETGKQNISATAFHWDPLDGSEMYSENNNSSILIIRDPKNFVSSSIPYVSPVIGIFSNLQNWGIFLSILGLIIFYFTYTRNNVPIEISIFGLKPFYLKSVNSFTGTLIFVAGMYLYFVFGRCPWDIPIVSGLDWLSNKYFDVLYYEYVTNSHSGIPYLSIMLGIIYVFILSLIIHLIAIPFYKGEFKIGEFLRRKITSTSAQPEMISYAVENKINREN